MVCCRNKIGYRKNIANSIVTELLYARSFRKLGYWSKNTNKLYIVENRNTDKCNNTRLTLKQYFPQVLALSPKDSFITHRNRERKPPETLAPSVDGSGAWYWHPEFKSVNLVEYSNCVSLEQNSITNTDFYSFILDSFVS